MASDFSTQLCIVRSEVVVYFCVENSEKQCIPLEILAPCVIVINQELTFELIPPLGRLHNV